MGCWGYQEIQSDNGLDRMAGAPSFLSWAQNNHNVLDVDRCLKESAARYRNNPDCKNTQHYQIEWDILAMSEILYHFINNTVLSGLGRLTIDDSYGWYSVTKVTASKEVIQYLIKGLGNYLKGDMRNFKTSGWTREEDYHNRCNWIKGIGQALTKIVNRSKTNQVTIYDKSTAKPEVFIYKHGIKMTSNHELNRLRLFVRNDVNYFYDYINHNPTYKVKVYNEVVIRKDSQGNSFYALVFHNQEGKQITIAKGKSADELIRNAIASQERGSLSEFEWYIWNLLYNKDMYIAYCNHLAQSKK